MRSFINKGTCLFSACALIACLAGFSVDRTNHVMAHQAPQDQLQEYISFSRTPCATYSLDYFKPNKWTEFISKEQAKDDLAFLKYLFNNAYSGREYWERKGIDFGAIYNKIENIIDRSSGRVRSEEIENALASALTPIVDGHLSIVGESVHNFCPHLDAYFTDIIVRQQANGAYSVRYSPSSHITRGTLFTGSKNDLFPTLSPTGVKEYLLGRLSRTTIIDLETSFNDRKVVLPLHRSYVSLPDSAIGSGVFSEYDLNGLHILGVSSFDSYYSNQLRAFANSASKQRLRQTFLLNLTGNTGGNSGYPEAFFKGLFGVALWPILAANLVSPPILQATSLVDGGNGDHRELVASSNRQMSSAMQVPYRYWSNIISHRRAQFNQWKGRVIVLVNGSVSSSGEAAVAMAKADRNSLIVGENTAGKYIFGDRRVYYLPNSGLQVWLGSKLFLDPNLKEGAGYYPDYWLDSHDPVSEIAKWSRDQKHYLFTPVSRKALFTIDFAGEMSKQSRRIRRLVGAILGPGEIGSKIEVDQVVRRQGKTSLRLEARQETTVFYALSMPIPTSSSSTVAANWHVRGSGIRRQGKQLDNCFVGLAYTDNDGQRQFLASNYDGTFPWTTGRAVVNLGKVGGRDLEFVVFLSKTGQLWISDAGISVVE